MDYQGNSNKKKESAKKPEKKVEKVVSSEVITRKQPVGAKLKAVFFGGEFKSAARYITADVLLPAFRNLMVDATTKGIERMVYGDTAPPRRRSAPQYGSRVQYNSPVRRGTGRDDYILLPDQPPRYKTPVKPQTNEIIIATREEAEMVLERLTDIVEQYDVASLADLYDLVGLTSTHVDNKWGWTYLNNAQIIQIREGYLLQLPQLESI